ncbi:hypothetical protein GKR48_05445 [Providencia sp. wls1943]|uniref:hypothetical protein n=1 Tax=Providencia sp. wls1943 TaxID=2675150 RepID=UPI0012B57798|nr:hypothetical protein [Providencia sp. wls1943]MTB66263.1 hypothetical protein [Providencia sp. wls1943]
MVGVILIIAIFIAGFCLIKTYKWCEFNKIKGFSKFMALLLSSFVSFVIVFFIGMFWYGYSQGKFKHQEKKFSCDIFMYEGVASKLDGSTKKIGKSLPIGGGSLILKNDYFIIKANSSSDEYKSPPLNSNENLDGGVLSASTHNSSTQGSIYYMLNKDIKKPDARMIVTIPLNNSEDKVMAMSAVNCRSNN